MGNVYRPKTRSLVFLALIGAAFLLSACSGQVANNNYAGLSTDGQTVFLANGPEVIAYDVVDQERSWSFPTEPSNSLLFFAPPSSEDGQVVFGDYGQAGGFFSPRVTVSIYALDTEDSGLPRTLWTNSEAATDKIVAGALQIDDKVFVGTADNHILALDRSSGAELWDYRIGHAVWGKPTYRDGVVYVAAMDWSVYALNADSGELIWSTPLNGALASQPVLGDDLLYVSSFDGNMHALDIATGEAQWSAAAEDVIWGSPALGDGRLYFGDIAGNLYAVNAQTGETAWSKQTGGVIQAAPVLENGTLYVASQTSGEAATGSLTAYSAEDGSQLWQTTTPVPLWTTPVVAGDSIVVALQNTDAVLIGYDLTSGSEQWRYTPPATS